MYRLLILSIVLGAATPTLATTQAAVATSRLAPQPRQILIARTVVQVTQRHHYPAETLDAGFAHNTIEEYIDTLDPGHFYFTRKDVDRFYAQYDDKLAGDLKNGNLEPAFDIYALYNTRVHQRIRYAIGLLAKKPDFNSMDRYRFLRPFHNRSSA